MLVVEEIIRFRAIDERTNLQKGYAGLPFLVSYVLPLQIAFQWFFESPSHFMQCLYKPQGIYGESDALFNREAEVAKLDHPPVWIANGGDVLLVGISVDEEHLFDKRVGLQERAEFA